MKAPEYVERIEALEASQTAQDAALEAALETALEAASGAAQTADSKVATVNGLAPDAAGNVDVGGMPLGAAFPYTGSDVPAGTLRADGTTYTGMQASFPDFYAWVKQSGLAVPMADYALVEGSCGYYGLDESTGAVRMPALAAGVFGAGAASEYGLAVEAGLPGITGTVPSTRAYNATGAFHKISGSGYNHGSGLGGESLGFDASLSSPVYGKSDTVTPSHVKYPWVIVVYNAAVPASVAEAAEFVGLLEGKADKASVEAKAEVDLANVTAEGRERVVGWGMPDYSAGVQVTLTTSGYTAPSAGYLMGESNMSGAGNRWFLVNNSKVGMESDEGGSICFPVSKGDVIKVSESSAGNIWFYPLKGV